MTIARPRPSRRGNFEVPILAVGVILTRGVVTGEAIVSVVSLGVEVGVARSGGFSGGCAGRLLLATGTFTAGLGTFTPRCVEER